MPIFECKAYRNERYVAYADIEAATPEEALKLLQDQAHDLNYNDYAGHMDAADHFVVERPDAPHCPLEYENIRACVPAMRDLLRDVLDRLDAIGIDFDGEIEADIGAIRIDIHDFLSNLGSI